MSEEQLIRRAQQGDNGAFEELLLLHQPAGQATGTSIAQNIRQNIEGIIIGILTAAHMISHEQSIQRNIPFHRLPAFCRLYNFLR